MMKKSTDRYKKETEQITKDYEMNFNKWRDYDLLTAIIALVSLSLAIVDFEYTWATAREQTAVTGTIYADYEQ